MSSAPYAASASNPSKYAKRGVGRPVEQVLELAKELRAQAVEELCLADLPHFEQDLPARWSFLSLAIEASDEFQRGVVDEAELVEHAPEVRDRLARPALGRDMPLEHQERRPRSVGVHHLDRAGEPALQHVHEHLDERRLGKGPSAVGGGRSKRGLRPCYPALESTRALGAPARSRGGENRAVLNGHAAFCFRCSARHPPTARAECQKSSPRPAQRPLQLAQFEVLRRLGAGGMAEVFLAKKRGAEGTFKLLVVKRILPTVRRVATPSARCSSKRRRSPRA